jgi:hypothetical protein
MQALRLFDFAVKLTKQPSEVSRLIWTLRVPQMGPNETCEVNVDGEAYECARRYMIRLEAHNCTAHSSRHVRQLKEAKGASASREEASGKSAGG